MMSSEIVQQPYLHLYKDEKPSSRNMFVLKPAKDAKIVKVAIINWREDGSRKVSHVLEAPPTGSFEYGKNKEEAIHLKDSVCFQGFWTLVRLRFRPKCHAGKYSVQILMTDGQVLETLPFEVMSKRRGMGKANWLSSLPEYYESFDTVQNQWENATPVEKVFIDRPLSLGLSKKLVKPEGETSQYAENPVSFFQGINTTKLAASTSKSTPTKTQQPQQNAQKPVRVSSRRRSRVESKASEYESDSDYVPESESEIEHEPEQMEDEEDDYEYHGMETDVGEQEFESVNTKMKMDEPQDDSMNVDTQATPISTTDYRPGLYRYDSAAIPSSKLYGSNGLEHDEEYGDDGYLDDGYFDDYDEADAEEEQVNFLFTDGEEMFSPNSLAQGLIDVDALGLQPL